MLHAAAARSSTPPAAGPDRRASPYRRPPPPPPPRRRAAAPTSTTTAPAAGQRREPQERDGTLPGPRQPVGRGPDPVTHEREAAARQSRTNSGASSHATGLPGDEESGRAESTAPTPSGSDGRHSSRNSKVSRISRTDRKPFGRTPSPARPSCEPRGDVDTARRPEDRWAPPSAHITIDCTGDPYDLARYWSALLGRPLADDDAGRSGGPDRGPGGGPSLLFVHVGEGKAAKNRLRLDLWPTGRTRAEEVARAIADSAPANSPTARAAPTARAGSPWPTPEGNEFSMERGRTS